MSTDAPTLWTLGHATRSTQEFDALLDRHAIEALADVRRFPGSRTSPQFGKDALVSHLAAAGREYCWLESLGGRRRASPSSVNVGWRHPAFRAYADHLVTEAFAQGLDALVNLGCGMRTAMMCSEILWWRCHRRLVSDVLATLGLRVVHILDLTHAVPHVLSPPARLVRGRLDYSGPED